MNHKDRKAHQMQEDSGLPDPSKLTDAQLRLRIQQLEAEVVEVRHRNHLLHIMINRLRRAHDVSRLLTSVQSFLERFGAKPSVKFATDRAGSEFFEYVIALSEAQSASHPDEKALCRAKAAEELVDVFYAGYSAFLRVGGTPEQMLAAWNAVIDKNNAKTPNTHTLTPQGSIERKGW